MAKHIGNTAVNEKYVQCVTDSLRGHVTISLLNFVVQLVEFMARLKMGVAV